MKQNQLCLALLTFTLAVSCSKLKEAGDMPSTTNKMKATTEQMSVTTNKMFENMETLLELSRSKEAEATRSEKFKEILDKRNNCATKITAAAVFFKSFEYQLATFEEISHLEHKMDEFRLEAVNEFTRRIKDVYEKINPKKMSPTDTSKKYNDELAFYAIAAALHMNHHFQVEQTSEAKLKTTSFLDIIKTTLRKEQNGEHLKEHEEILLTGINREIAIELLKARVDIISAVALSYMSDKRKMGLGSKLKALAFKLSNGRVGEINIPITLEDSNKSTKNTVRTTLKEAIKTREFLKEIGIEKQLEKDIRSAFNNIQLEKSEDQKDMGDLQEIEGMIENLLL